MPTTYEQLDKDYRLARLRIAELEQELAAERLVVPKIAQTRIQRLEQELAKYTGAEANEYGQTQQRMAELQQELAEYKLTDDNNPNFEYWLMGKKKLVKRLLSQTVQIGREEIKVNYLTEENQRLKEQLRALQEKD